MRHMLVNNRKLNIHIISLENQFIYPSPKGQ